MNHSNRKSLCSKLDRSGVKSAFKSIRMVANSEDFNCQMSRQQSDDEMVEVNQSNLKSEMDLQRSRQSPFLGHKLMQNCPSQLGKHKLSYRHSFRGGTDFFQHKHSRFLGGDQVLFSPVLKDEFVDAADGVRYHRPNGSYQKASPQKLPTKLHVLNDLKHMTGHGKKSRIS